jgi:hypothetical protein
VDSVVRFDLRGSRDGAAEAPPGIGELINAGSTDPAKRARSPVGALSFSTRPQPFACDAEDLVVEWEPVEGAAVVLDVAVKRHVRQVDQFRRAATTSPAAHRTRAR